MDLSQSRSREVPQQRSSPEEGARDSFSEAMGHGLWVGLGPALMVCIVNKNSVEAGTYCLGVRGNRKFKVVTVSAFTDSILSK